MSKIYIYQETSYSNNLYKVGLTIQDVYIRENQQTNSKKNQAKSKEVFKHIYEFDIDEKYDIKTVECGIHYYMNIESENIYGGEWFYIKDNPIEYVESIINKVLNELDENPDKKFNQSNKYFKLNEINSLKSGKFGFVYIYKFKDYKDNEWKIGATTQETPYKRIKQQYTTAFKAHKIEIIAMIDITRLNELYNKDFSCFEVEHYIHNSFKDRRLTTVDGVLKEWFEDITIVDIEEVLKEIYETNNLNLFDINNFYYDDKIYVEYNGKPNKGLLSDSTRKNIDKFYKLKIKNENKLINDNFYAGVYSINNGIVKKEPSCYEELKFILNNKYIMINKDDNYFKK